MPRLVKRALSHGWFAVAAALCVLVVTQLPYEINRAQQTPERMFSDSLKFQADYSIYFSFVRQAAEGRWSFENRITPERNRPIFVNVLWLVLGWLKAGLGVSWAVLFHLWRVLGAVSYLLAFAYLCRLFLPDAPMRRLAIVVFATGGGLGWIFMAARKLGIETFKGRWWLGQDAPADTFGAFHPFMQVLLFPFHACASALLVVALALYIRAERLESPRHRAAAGVCCLLLGLVRPHEMTIAVGTILLYGIGRSWYGGGSWRDLAARCWIVALPAPVVLYFLYVVSADPVFKWMHRQNVLPPLYPLDLALTLGLVAIPAAAGVRVLVRGGWSDPGQGVLAAWLLTVFGLFYAFPLFTYSLEFGNAFLAPLVLLAFLPSAGCVPLLRRVPRAALALLVVVNAGTSLWLVGHLAIEWRRPKSPAFIDGQIVDASRWLESNTRRSDVVLSFPTTGHWILRYGGNKVFIASPVSTVDYRDKRKMVTAFFDSKTPIASKEQLLDTYEVAYVVYGPEERKTGFDPTTLARLRRVYSNGGVDLFAVDREGGLPS